jgi:opacity protein-like surface antigen
MKKILAAVALAALAALAATAAFAAPTAPSGAGVSLSVHDMNVVGDASNNIVADEQGRVCAFCHTPHHAIDPGASDYMPLWSHNLSAATSYSQYDSQTFDAKTVGAIDQLAGPSRLCMSCHDGTVAPDQHYGTTAATGGTMFTGDNFTGATFQIGVANAFGLSNDHPIGFDYTLVQAEEVTTGSDGLNLIDASTIYTGTAKKVLPNLFGGTIMTCATCHDVHNKDNVVNTGATVKNYLVYADQNGSQLCLTCHKK